MSGKLAEIAERYLRKALRFILKANCGQENGGTKVDRIGSLPKSSLALVEHANAWWQAGKLMNSLHISEITVSNKDNNLSRKEITTNLRELRR